MEYYKVLMNKMKIQVDDLNEKNKIISQQSETLIGELKTADEKLNTSKYNLNTVKKSLVLKDNEYNKIKVHLSNLETFSSGKEHIEKKMSDYQKQIEALQRELE